MLPTSLRPPPGFRHGLPYSLPTTSPPPANASTSDSSTSPTNPRSLDVGDFEREAYVRGLASNMTILRRLFVLATIDRGCQGITISSGSRLRSSEPIGRWAAMLGLIFAPEVAEQKVAAQLLSGAVAAASEAAEAARKAQERAKEAERELKRQPAWLKMFTSGGSGTAAATRGGAGGGGSGGGAPKQLMSELGKMLMRSLASGTVTVEAELEKEREREAVEGGSKGSVDEAGDLEAWLRDTAGPRGTGQEAGRQAGPSGSGAKAGPSSVAAPPSPAPVLEGRTAEQKVQVQAQQQQQQQQQQAPERVNPFDVAADFRAKLQAQGFQVDAAAPASPAAGTRGASSANTTTSSSTTSTSTSSVRPPPAPGAVQAAKPMDRPPTSAPAPPVATEPAAARASPGAASQGPSAEVGVGRGREDEEQKGTKAKVKARPKPKGKGFQPDPKAPRAVAAAGKDAEDKKKKQGGEEEDELEEITVGDVVEVMGKVILNRMAGALNGLLFGKGKK